MNIFKYPKTPLVPWSHKVTSDDIFHLNIELLEHKDVVVLEKIDGENTSIFHNCQYYARSVNYSSHPSHDKVKSYIFPKIHKLPSGWRICGENCVAVHTMKYDELPAPFLCFSIWNEKNQCLSWPKTEEWCKHLEIQTVPILYHGRFNLEKIKQCYTGKSAFGGEQEGYVIRNMDCFHYDDFHKNIAKYVRQDFSDLLNKRSDGKHWRQGKYEENKIK